MNALRMVGLAGALALGLATAASAGEKGQFDVVKGLVGEWSGKGKHGTHEMDVSVVYKTTAAGSAVVETISPGDPHEMVTMYHRDGEDLVLTHYCAMGNQPRMKAERNGPEGKLSFKFAGAGNLKSVKDPHMHDMTLEVLAPDHIKMVWVNYKDGKPAGEMVMDLKRKKG
jgi:hypothetical protein